VRFGKEDHALTALSQWKRERIQTTNLRGAYRQYWSIL